MELIIPVNNKKGITKCKKCGRITVLSREIEGVKNYKICKCGLAIKVK